MLAASRARATPSTDRRTGDRDAAGCERHNADRPFAPTAELAALPAPRSVADRRVRAHDERAGDDPVGLPVRLRLLQRHQDVRPARARPRRRDVLVELERYRHRDFVFFYDDNFVVNKQRTGRLLRGMIERGFTMRWSAQMRADAVYRDKRTRAIDHEFWA